jgi:hypothetical protein
MSDMATQISSTVNSATIENLSEQERSLLDEVVRRLRTIRYGSISLTVHDGRVVEIHKTEKLRGRT